MKAPVKRVADMYDRGRRWYGGVTHVRDDATGQFVAKPGDHSGLPFWPGCTTQQAQEQEYRLRVRRRAASLMLELDITAAEARALAVQQIEEEREASRVRTARNFR